MRRQLTGILLTAVLLSGGILSAQAAEQLGTVCVEMDHGGASAWGAEMTLFFVGSPTEGGYRLQDSVGGGFVRKEDALSPDLSQWLSEGTLGEGRKQALQENGTTVYSELQEGLYLLTQSKAAQGFRRAEPFLIPIPCNGEWEVTAFPKMQEIFTEPPQTGQHPAPLIGAMGLVLSGMGLAACWEKIRKNR